jgi:PAS domain S-box-containing protein
MSQALANDFSMLADDPALAPFLKDGMAAFVWSGDGARLIWVSPAGRELAERLAPGGRLDVSAPLRDRIAILAAGLAPRRGVRLERLRLIPDSSTVLTCACHSLTLADGSNALLTAIVGRIPDLTPPAPPPPPVADEQVHLPARDSALSRGADASPATTSRDDAGQEAGKTGSDDAASMNPVAGERDIDPAHEAPGPISATDRMADAGRAAAMTTATVPPDATGQPWQDETQAEDVVRPRNSRARFLWETDAAGRLVRLGPVFRELFAQEDSQRRIDALGLGWLELAAQLRLVPQSDPRLDEALAGEAAWSLRNLSWRLSGGSDLAPVDLSAVPVRDPSGGFSGFRGFGVVRLDEMRLAPRPAAPVTAEVPTPALPRAAADLAPVTDDGASADSPPDIIADDGDDADTLRGETQARFMPYLTAQAQIVPIGELEPDADTDPAQEHAEAVDAQAGGADMVPVAIGEENAIDHSGTDAELAAAEPVEQMPAPMRAADAEPSPDKGGPAGEGSATLADPAAASPALSPALSQALSQALSPAPSPASPDEQESDGAAGSERLTASERNAFREIARALGARLSDAGATTRRTETGISNVTPLRRPQAAAGEAALPERVDAPVQPAAGPSGAIAGSTQETGREPIRAAVRVPATDFAQLIDRLPIGVLISRDGEALYANRTLLDLAGYADLAALDAAGGPATLIEGPIHTPETEIAAMGLITAEGARVPVEVKLAAIVWQGAPATAMEFRRTSVVDVAARLKAVELDLKAREARIRELSSILDTATDGTVVLDVRGRIVALNRSAEALFGYDQNEVVGEPFTLLVAPESHPMALDYLEGLKSNGVASILNDGREIIGRVRQGGRIALFMTMGAVAREPELKFCAVLRDMTAWKNAERELIEARRAAEQASAQKSDFLAKISHEIRTPLNAIIGFAEVMLEERFGPVGNERYKDYLRDIHASGGHVISLVNDLLDLAKIEAGRLELTFASVDVNAVVASCVSLLQPQAQRGRIVLRTSLGQKLPSIVADERSLRQVALNLLSNAVKFTDPGGQVIVSTALTERGEVALRVRDTGVGMAEAEIKAAMEPFRQLATSRRTGGTGLGLPLTKALVEANRGSFAITSAKGEGTLVEVLFPPTRVLAS